MALSVSDAAHLLRRSGFGVTQANLGELRGIGSRVGAVNRVLDLSRVPQGNPPPILAIDGSPVPASTENLPMLAQWWLERMRSTPVPIVEKMALFWHSHFASSPDKVDDLAMLADQNQLFRNAGLGSFHDLVQKVAVDPAMLVYLDNFANVKAAPQENFARELMEVFTLGVGFRDEADVAGVARAWTGHGLNKAGRRYEFHPAEHDNGTKALFGLEPRNWNGPATITAITKGVKAEQSSRHITAKLFSFFAYPVTVDDEVVHRLAARFRSNDLNVLGLLRTIFLSDEFWSPPARYALVRSPSEFVVAALQAIGQGAGLARPDQWMGRMGQTLFRPPSVAGWGTNGYWVSTANTWAKAGWAQQIRDLVQLSGVVADVQDLAPRDVANRGFQQFGIVDPSPNTRAAVERWVERTRADGNANLVARNLVQIMLLTPEFQLA